MADDFIDVEKGIYQQLRSEAFYVMAAAPVAAPLPILVVLAFARVSILTK